jgi:hypothetical protein
MENEQSKKVLADIFRRGMSFMLDGVFALAIGIGLYFAVGNTLIANARNEKGEREALQSFVEEAGIADDKGYAFNYPAKFDDGAYGYQKLEDIVWNYYTVFLPTNPNASFLESDDFAGDKSSAIEVGKWAYARIYNLDNEAEINLDIQPYYCYPDPIDYTKKPVLNETTAEALQKENETVSLDLLHYYSRRDLNTNEGVYLDIFKHFSRQPHYMEVTASLATTSYYKTLPSFIAAPLLIYLIFPLFFKYGQTPAKLIMKLGVVDKEHKEPKKYQILLHGLYPALIPLVLATPLAGMFSILIMSGLVLIDAVGGRIAKCMLLHDKLSRTDVVELRLLMQNNEAPTPIVPENVETPSEPVAEQEPENK